MSKLKWSKKWVPRHLQHTNIRFVKDSMYYAWDGERQYGMDGDELVASLEVGNNFTINAKEGNGFRVVNTYVGVVILVDFSSNGFVFIQLFYNVVNHTTYFMMC